MTQKRETFKEPEYFDKLIQSTEGWLVKFREKIADPGTDAEHRAQLRHSVFRNELELLIARYSRGDAISELKQSFLRVVTSFTEYQAGTIRKAHQFGQFDAYIYALWLVSISMLLGIDDGIFQTLLRELNNEGKDGLYERLVSLRVSGRPAISTLLYPKVYQPLFDALDATGEKQSDLIDKFLKSYYKGMRNAYWHDSHLGENAGFFGYWCFELAAFVKKLKIDDSTFANNIFYPVDLVRLKDSAQS